LNVFVRSKAHAIEQDVQKLRIVHDPKIHYDLLRVCQHTRIAFLSPETCLLTPWCGLQMSVLTLGAGIGDLALFKDLA
jgi:hypothetical protein